VAVSLSAILIPVSAAFTVIVLGARPGTIEGLSMVARGDRFVQLFVLEAALIPVWAPVAGVFLASEGAFASAWRLARVMTIASALVAASGAVLTTVLRAPLDGTTLAVSHVALWAETFACLALGSFCRAYAREGLDAAACALTVAISAGAAVFVAGPLLNVLPARVIDVLLDVSPVVGVSAAAGIDIFRAGVMYQLSPLAHMQMRYPDPAVASAAYVAIGLVLVLGVALRLNRPDFSPERTVQ